MAEQNYKYGLQTAGLILGTTAIRVIDCTLTEITNIVATLTELAITQ